MDKVQKHNSFNTEIGVGKRFIYDKSSFQQKKNA
jgi:hypothetical protein